MATIEKYAFNWLIPVYFTDTPIPFHQFIKYDGNGNPVGYYSYNEWSFLDGHKPFFTPSCTHAILGVETTSTKEFIEQLPGYLAAVSSDTVWVDGAEMGRWQDVDQTNYLWTLTTDMTVPYNYNEFVKVNPLFEEPV